MGQSNFGKRLRRIRLEKDVTQGDVAKALDVSVSFYSAIEVGKKPPTAKLLNTIVEVFELGMGEERKLHVDAAAAIDQIRINTRSARPKAQQVALSLARRFETLDDEKLEVIREVMNDD